MDDTLPVICGDADLVRIKYNDAKICLSKKSENKIKSKILLPKFVYAPLSAGETVGRVEYYLDDRLIKTSAIYSVADMYIENKKETLPKRFFDNIKAIWNNS